MSFCVWIQAEACGRCNCLALQRARSSHFYSLSLQINPHQSLHSPPNPQQTPPTKAPDPQTPQILYFLKRSPLIPQTIDAYSHSWCKGQLPYILSRKSHGQLWLVTCSLCFPDMCFSYQCEALKNVDFVQWDSELPQGKLGITWSNLIFIWMRSFYHPIIFYLCINFQEFGQNTSVIFKNICTEFCLLFNNL